MQGKLSMEQLSRRATRKRNNRLRRELPLLQPLLEEEGQLSEWLTSETEQKERIERQRKESKAWLSRMDDLDQVFIDRSAERRAIIAERVSAEQLSQMDEYVHNTWMVGRPAFIADYWHQRLIEHAPDIAQERCHLKDFHQVEAKYHDRCPGCKMDLSMLKPEPKEKELTLF